MCPLWPIRRAPPPSSSFTGIRRGHPPPQGAEFGSSRDLPVGGRARRHAWRAAPAAKPRPRSSRSGSPGSRRRPRQRLALRFRVSLVAHVPDCNRRRARAAPSCPLAHCPRCTVPISRLASPRIQPKHCLRNLRMHAIAPRFGVSATQARSQGARACSSRMSRYSEKLCRRVPTRARWGKCWRRPPRLVVRAYQISSSLLTGFYLVGAHLPRRWGVDGEGVGGCNKLAGAQII